MKTYKVISPKDLPRRLPFCQTVVIGLLLDRLQAPGWVWGVAGTIVVAGWIGYIIEIFWQEWYVRMFKPEESKE